jgi:hypothetical protein
MMIIPAEDERSAARRALDEQIAAEPPLTPPDLPADAPCSPVESHFGRHRRPLAVAGIVENGLIRLLDPAAKLPEHSRVIIVTTEAV